MNRPDRYGPSEPTKIVLDAKRRARLVKLAEDMAQGKELAQPERWG